MRTTIPFAVVAIAALAVATMSCRPKAAPSGPGDGPSEIDRGQVHAPRAEPRPPAREVLVGEMCPEAAASRPAVLPMFARRLSWITEADELSAAVEENRVRQLSVLGWWGGRAGIFSVAGSAGLRLDRPAAIGSYAGRSPCQPPSQPGAQPDPTCLAAQSNCGLAIGALEAPGYGSRPFGEDPEPLELPVGKACLAESVLLVDVDGDRRPEAFPAARFRGPVRAPAEEVSAVPRGGASCEPGFAIRHVLPPEDPKHWQGLDLLGVVDLDGDGRMELIMSYHYSDRRTWAIYTAPTTPARLELVGESTPWPR